MTNLALHHAVDLQVPIGCAACRYPGDVLVGDGEAWWRATTPVSIVRRLRKPRNGWRSHPRKIENGPHCVAPTAERATLREYRTAPNR